MGVKIDNIDLKEYYSFTVIDIQGRDTPQLKEYTTTDDNDLQYHMYSKYQPRRLVLRGFIYDSRVKTIGGSYVFKTAKTLLNEFTNLITASINQPKEIYFDDTQRTIIGRITEKPISVERQNPHFNSMVYQVEVSIICDEPLGTSTSWGSEGAVYQARQINSDAMYNIEKDISLYPTTLVNLLGVNGNFEDANTLQTDWTASNTTNSKITGLFGTKAQKCVSTSTDGQHYIYYAMPSYAVTGHKYFFCMSVKNVTSSARLYMQYRNSAGDFVGSASVSNVFNNTNYTKMCGTLEVLSLYSTPVLYYFIAILKTDGTVSYAGTNEEINIDGAMVVDLTNMGDLPIPLRRFFNSSSYTTWASLATTSNITAGGRTQTGEAWLSELLPFVDSIATVGWSYTNGAVTTTIENRGENLFKRQEFKDYINTYDSSAFYVKDEGLDVVDFNHAGYFDKPFMRGKFKPKTSYTFKVQAKTYNASNYPIIYVKYTDGVASGIAINTAVYETKTLVSIAANKSIDYVYISYSNLGRSRISLSDFMIYEGTTSKAYTPALNNVLSLNTTLFSHLGNEDMMYYDNGLKKLKRWHYETVVKSTTFANTTYNGTGSCVLVKSTGEIYYSTITNKDIAEGSIPDGTYTVWYCLASPTVELVYYTGNLNLITGNNQMILSSLLLMQIEGKKKHLII